MTEPEHVSTQNALVRFSVLSSGPPEVVVALPGNVSLSSTDYLRDLAKSPNGDFYFIGGIGGSELRKFDATTIAGATTIATLPNGSREIVFGPDGLLYFLNGDYISRFDVESNQFLGSFIDLSPFKSPNPRSYFAAPFFDDRGHLLVINNYDIQNGDFASLLEFNGQSGAYRRTVFTDQLTDLESYFTAGIYLTVPEPSSAILAAIGLAIVYGIRFRGI